MKAFIVRVLLIFIGAILLIQLWIFSSLVWWRTHEVDTTMFMRIDYWSDTSEPIIHEWLDYDDISDNFKHAMSYQKCFRAFSRWPLSACSR